MITIKDLSDEDINALLKLRTTNRFAMQVVDKAYLEFIKMNDAEVQAEVDIYLAAKKFKAEQELAKIDTTLQERKSALESTISALANVEAVEAVDNKVDPQVGTKNIN